MVQEISRDRKCRIGRELFCQTSLQCGKFVDTCSRSGFQAASKLLKPTHNEGPVHEALSYCCADKTDRELTSGFERERECQLLRFVSKLADPWRVMGG
jgi:hypothetical protein